MTRAEARTRVRRHVNETDTTTKWSDAEINDYVRQANEDLYYRIARDAPEHLHSVATWTWPANTTLQDITAAGKLGADFLKIKSLAYSTTSATFGSGNVPIPMTYADMSEIMGLFTSDDVFGATANYHYGTSGPNLYIAPYASSALYLQALWIPRPTSLDAGATPDTNNLLDGKLLQVHKLICIKAAQMALAGRRERSDKLDDKEKDAEVEYTEEFTSDRTTGPRFMSDPFGASWRT